MPPITRVSKKGTPATASEPLVETHPMDPMTVIRDALQILARCEVAPDPQALRMNYFFALNSLNPPTFAGGIDLPEAENWLRVMCKNLDFIDVPTEYKVGLATFYLEEMAEDWWKSVAVDYPPEEMVWEQFEAAFRDYYCNARHRQNMVSPYYSLEQGDLSVSVMAPRRAYKKHTPTVPSESSVETQPIYPMDALRDARQNLAQHDVATDSQTLRMNYFFQLRSLNPPTFAGGFDLPEAENWLRVMRKNLNAIGVPTKYRVKFATFYLEDMAQYWWKSVAVDYPREEMVWEQFEVAFRDNYCNAAYREIVVRTYYSLEQGDLSVLEYYAKFSKLSMHIKGLDSLDKIVKFRMGLRPKIRHSIAALMFNSLPDALAAAQWVETDLCEQFGEYKPMGEKSQHSGGKIIRKDQTKSQSKGSQSISSGGADRNYTCHACEKSGHRRNDCPNNQGSYLEGMIEDCWQSIALDYPPDEMIWEQLEAAFGDNYCNARHREIMVSAYYSLKQGDLSVLEYYAKFSRLSKHIKGLDPLDKIVKFRMGLRPKIRLLTAVLEFNSLPDALAAAQRAEAVLCEQFGEYKPMREKCQHSGGKIIRKDQKKSQSKGSQNSLFSRPYTGGPGKNYVCYTCGNPGHWRNDCPNNKRFY